MSRSKQLLRAGALACALTLVAGVALAKGRTKEEAKSNCAKNGGTWTESDGGYSCTYGYTKCTTVTSDTKMNGKADGPPQQRYCESHTDPGRTDVIRFPVR